MTRTAAELSLDRVGWGILSTGQIASVFAHDLALLGSEASLAAVSSRSLARAEAFAREHGFARAYGSAAELVADERVDVVYIATPHSDHFTAARMCLQAGKAVLVEKPLTTSPAQTEQLLDLARDRGLFCMEAMWTRVHPLIRRAAELVRSAELGQIRHVAASFGFAFDGPDSHRLLDPVQAGGAIWDAGVYPVHAVQLFLGEPDDLLGFGHHARTGVDSHAVATMRYRATEDRGPATATVACTIEANLPTRLEIYGTHGHILVDDFFIRPEQLTVFRGNDKDLVPEVLLAQWPGSGYTFEAQEVMRCLRTGELQSPLVPWADTSAVARTLDRWLAAVGRT